MMSAPLIQPFQQIVPMIYAYTTPGITYHEGWIKIGYTDRQTVEKRIDQQTHTAGVKWRLEWKDNALYKDGSGESFEDKDFHSWLQTHKQTPREQGTEWFKLDGQTSRQYFDQFASREIPKSEEQASYVLRKEQAEAVEKTKAFFEAGGEDFLWNAKPRFGKTLTTYDLIQKMGCKKVLVVSNRPSIANSWADDFFRFIGWQGQYAFVSDNDALKKRAGVLSREEFTKSLADPAAPRKLIAFESLQGLKGSIYFGGTYNKLEWMSKNNGLEFDLLIVDESHEGVDTLKTERAFDNIARKHTLYLSGTPFKQIARSDFAEGQIFNWSYVDEQEAKENWQGEGHNPYQRLPRLNLFTYQLSEMIRDKAQKGIDLGGDAGIVDFAFDLNEFFSTKENGRFVYEEEVRRFLRGLATQEKYPFSTPELRNELAHTMWHLNRVASAKALAKLLAEDEIFREYKVILAVGDAKNEDMPNLKALEQVRKAIRENPKTITLTVGQLTVGITIPEWTGVLMLCNMTSPAAYMQAAFRAQNPWIKTLGAQRFEKENSYVFDFDPARTLIIFDEFANDLYGGTAAGKGTGEERKRNLQRLLNFLPVLGEDDQGRMVELDAEQVLSIPRRLKSQEVVKRGFMCNFLFQNIGAIFSAPGIVQQIMNKLPTASEEKRKAAPENLAKMDDIPVDGNGEVDIPDSVAIGQAQGLFGPKVYETIAQKTMEQAESIIRDETLEVGKKTKSIGGIFKNKISNEIIAPIAEAKGLKNKTREKIERQVHAEIDRKMEKLAGDYEQKARIAKATLEQGQQKAETVAQKDQCESSYKAALETALADLTTGVMETASRYIEEKSVQIIRQIDEAKAREEKRTVEDEIRAHLRGFSRTIPSFIMAYGDDKLTLANFDSYTDPDVFREVASISLDEFRFLRDGGDYIDEGTGETRHFDGHLFDEIVFNDSVKEFLAKKRDLANYFDENHDEDIFDYIPPQKTNQIFTPRWVVVMMVDNLEKENPGCFDDPDNTFADLYMKSGLYITEIVKRLYRSDGLKKAFPDNKERIRHILEKQVYGIAPTRIIYLIATNYILGFDGDLKEINHNFVETDTVNAARDRIL